MYTMYSFSIEKLVETATSLQVAMSKKCAILIVEDDDYTRESLCDLLEAEGFDVTSCDNGSHRVEFRSGEMFCGDNHRLRPARLERGGDRAVFAPSMPIFVYCRG